jgi:hypothetical protein
MAAAIAVVVYLRKRDAPEAARLLPEADAVAYVNLRLLRLARVFEQAPPVSQAPEYKDFVAATGFQVERDLDYLAIAVHAPGSQFNPAPTRGQPGWFGEQARYSEIFIGRFDAQRVTAYFRKLATRTERYRDAETFNIPSDGRTVRVAIVGVDTVAVSNTQDPAVIRQMIDRYRAAARPRTGPSVVREYYERVPLGSVAWVIGRIPPSPQTKLSLPAMEVPAGSLAGSAVVASARYLGAVHLRVEAFTPAESNARNLLESAQSFLTIFRSLQAGVGAPNVRGADPDVKAFFDSIKVEQEKERVRLTATIPEGFIQKAMREPPPGLTSPEPAAPVGEKKPAPPAKRPPKK